MPNEEYKELYIDPKLKEKVLNDPEYKRYCELFEVNNPKDDNSVMSFGIWKLFGGTQ